jgi:hypothetical protein
VTISGKVSSLAIWIGMPTWSKARLGLGDITVLPLYSTLLPDRLPLNLPYFPFILWMIPLQEFLTFLRLLDSDDSEFIYWLNSVYNIYWFSLILSQSFPSLIHYYTNNCCLYISNNLIVKSSSLVLSEDICTVGLVHRGGTGIILNNKSLGSDGF